MNDGRWSISSSIGHLASILLILEQEPSMPVVKIPTPLRPHANGLDSVEATGSTVGEVLGQVFEQHPGLKERIFDGTELRRFVNVYVNNEDIRYLDDLDTKVEPKDEVSIIPAVAGG
jgi:sulfur-carrier protein